jgi:hypothetical protein
LGTRHVHELADRQTVLAQERISSTWYALGETALIVESSAPGKSSCLRRNGRTRRGLRRLCRTTIVSDTRHKSA